ncbi:alpha/beta fold hydrolase [Nakamurella sp. GG22]
MQDVVVPISRGRTMHATIVGPVDGQPAVALHGLGGSTDQNLPALEAMAGYYGLRIYAIDLPNHGRSCKVGLLHFRVSYFADLIVEAVRALNIRPTVIVGHSFGGQLAAMVSEEVMADSLQPILINPAMGTAWDRKLRRCWRRPWLFVRLVQELGYDDGNVARGELYHAGRLLRSILDMFLDRDLRPYRRFQVTLALLRNCDTASVLRRLMNRGLRPIIVQGALDRSTPAGENVHFVDGFHSWLHEATGPQVLVAVLETVFPRPSSAR